jgi:hypothetical protein
MREAETLIATLADDLAPVRPLRPPLARAFAWLGAAALIVGVAIYLLGDVRQLSARFGGSEGLAALEMAAMLLTGTIAVVAAFFAAIPGRSRRWRLAPVVPFAAWLLLSGAGCYRDLVRAEPSGLALGVSFDCLLFIVVVSVVLGAPLLWLLSRARPIEPLPVALLGGLGVAALSAFTLSFFHPFAVTVIDLAFHLLAIGLVMGAAALLNRRALSPA